jgi:hypothetical protein
MDLVLGGSTLLSLHYPNGPLETKLESKEKKRQHRFKVSPIDVQQRSTKPFL